MLTGLVLWGPALAAEDEDPAQDCMMAVLSPELDGVYDAKAPEFEVMISSGCGCPDNGLHEIEIRVSRENNKRHLNATTYMPCSTLKTDGGVVDLVDLRDGIWEGTVAVNTLDLYHDVRFKYITPFNPRIEVLLPLPGYVFGRNTNPVVVVHVCDVTNPIEPLLGIRVQVSVDNAVVGETKNPGRDKYIHLRTEDGHYFPDGVYNVQLQTIDLLGRHRGEPAHMVVVIDSTVETGVQPGVAEELWCPVDDRAESCPKCSELAPRHLWLPLSTRPHLVSPSRLSRFLRLPLALAISRTPHFFVPSSPLSSPSPNSSLSRARSLF